MTFIRRIINSGRAFDRAAAFKCSCMRQSRQSGWHPRRFVMDEILTRFFPLPLPLPAPLEARGLSPVYPSHLRQDVAATPSHRAASSWELTLFNIRRSDLMYFPIFLSRPPFLARSRPPTQPERNSIWLLIKNTRSLGWRRRARYLAKFFLPSRGARCVHPSDVRPCRKEDSQV